MSSQFLVFSFIFGLAICAGLVFRLLHQPAFLGYILVGLLVGSFGLFNSGEVRGLLDILSSAGVMLLLFLVGLEMDIGQVKKLGAKALFVGIGQIGLTVLLFAFVANRLGLALPSSLLLGVVLSFSSTIIVIKLLSEKHDLDSLTGKMAVAVLLMQDLAAIMLMIVFGNGDGDGLLMMLVKAVLLIAIVILSARKIMPTVLHRLARSTDELILFSLAWCFVLGAVVASPIFGLSLPIGGFLAGLALSGSFEHHHIATKIKPIRDFFLTIFFVGLGLSLRFEASVVMKAIYLSLVVIVVKPLIVWFLMRVSGFKQRVAFNTGVLFGQVSEFSFILMGVGMKMGSFTNEWLSLVSLVGLISIAVSGYLIIENEIVFRLIKPLLNFVFKENLKSDLVEEAKMENHVVLFGCRRMGRSILSHLKGEKDKVLIVDFDPEVVTKMTNDGWRVIYADASDTEAYDQFGLSKARMVISTMKDLRDNITLLSEIKRRKLTMAVVVDAETPESAKALYAAGATYVIFPHFVGGLHLGELVRRGVSARTDFVRYRESQQEAMAGVYV